MRIALITTEYITEPSSFDGGVANLFYKIAKTLKHNGHEPIVFVSSTSSEVIQHDGVKVVRINPSPTFWYKVLDVVTRFQLQISLNSLLMNFAFKAAILKEHNSNPIDIQHYVGINGTGLIKTNKIPAIIFISGYQKWINQEQYEKAKSLKEKQPFILEKLLIQKSKFLYTSSLVVSSKILQDTQKNIPVIETPYIFEVEEKDHSLLQEIQIQTNDNPFLLYFGRLGVWKGVAEIGAILHDLFQKYPHFYFVFIGKDKGYRNQDMLEYLKKQAGGHANRIIHYPNQTHARLYPVLEAAYTVVTPSRAENLSNVSIETMAHKKVLIGTRGASFDQLIDDGINGFLCEINDPPSLLDAIERAIALSPEEKEKMEEKAFERIQRLHPDIVVGQLIEYYKEIITDFNG